MAQLGMEGLLVQESQPVERAVFCSEQVLELIHLVR